jgi:hypothetical protein
MGEELERWVEYVPRWARDKQGGSHIQARYTAVRVEDGGRVPQMVEASCQVCGGRYRNECRQGRPRQHVGKFAQQHLHADVRNKPAPVRVPR